jgi:hypothetical protein
MIRSSRLALIILVLARAARADGPITDRNYAIDAYHGASVADYRVIGMGGVSLATAEGATGLLANAAAAASRPATSTSWFDWDWLLDLYTPGLGVDADNSGIPQERMIGKTGAFNLGLVGMFGAWGTAVTITGQVRDFSFPSGTQASLSAAMGRLTLARSFSDGEFVAGASLLVGGFTLKTPTSGTDLVNTANWSVEAGALWRPHGENVRVGLSFRPQIVAHVDGAGCDPNNCYGYILPQQAVFPWTVGAGVAYRFASTPWNQTVASDFRDEKSTILAADLIFTGPVTNGDGIDAFLEKQMQQSGASVSPSVRVGAEYEWVPGWFRIRGGAYWEPNRFDDVNGRLHVTLGFDVRFWSFSLWGSHYRLRASLAGDGARSYGNTVLSLGFWH